MGTLYIDLFPLLFSIGDYFIIIIIFVVVLFDKSLSKSKFCIQETTKKKENN